MYDKYADKDTPIDYLWRCTQCHVLRGRHEYMTDHGRIWEQRWYYRGYETEHPHHYSVVYEVDGVCHYRHQPPKDVVRAEHKKNRQHVRQRLHELEGSVDWDAIDDYIEPVNITGPNSALWNWW